jgi:steroid 5-alpha reductase family enzyme
LIIFLSYSSNKTPNSIQKITTILTIIWAIRLGTYLLYRVIKRGKDVRFDKIRINPIRFLVFFIIQAIWITITTFPVILINSNNNQTQNITIIETVGFFVWGFGFLYETIADYHKLFFNSNKENDGKLLKTGLYKYSRYFLFL